MAGEKRRKVSSVYNGVKPEFNTFNMTESCPSTLTHLLMILRRYLDTQLQVLPDVSRQHGP
ncbi:hypothetical protein F7725_013091 [Dissostichus mawsoni]|uniref:Uncharacterized protein n=1 Tax=Dissostichus mawsoni TaxID=36200 RepID=A0A7J5YRJ8_DISMA|nr:hypothetical protein F7725_013091 [Dissostichus mawsoni]